MRRITICLAAALALAGCASAHSMPRARTSASWSAFQTVKGVVDLSAARHDGSIVVAAAGRLWLRAPAGRLKPFAPAYRAPAGLEAYIVLSNGERTGGCRFPVGSVYALRLAHGDGVTVVTSHGRVRKFATLPAHGLENGIALDQTGRFGHRLLVTATTAGHTSLFAIDCRGRVQVLTTTAPRLEGGLVVAPPGFGRFGGDLIAPDEISGRIYAIAPSGHASLIVQTATRHGQDTGVESEGFVPARYSFALVADRLTPGNHHPGDNLILGLSRAALAAQGVRPGDLLAAGEGGGQTVVVSCAGSCQARLVALGPAQAHVEGHVTFIP